MAQSFPTPPSSPSPTCSDLRHRLKHLRLETEASGPQDRRLFLESRIRSFFTRDIVKDLLGCTCSRCDYHRRFQQITNPGCHVSSILPNCSGDPHDDSGYVILLALLTYIDCPATIYTFIRECRGDKKFKSQTADFTREYVRDKFLCHLPPEEANSCAEEFDWEKYRFAVQRVEGEHYEEYPQSAILPFVNEELLGRKNINGEIVSEGHSGDVYSFEILEEYCNFPEFPGRRTFARKELRRNTLYGRFCEERDNLLRVKKLKDKHLVEIVKSYKHGDRYNLIFPCATTNLDLLLREPSFEPFAGFQGPVPEHPLWEQMLGIARALHKVLEYNIPDTKLDGPLYGYHFDLKPANILFYLSGLLVITDFGQAKFKEVGTSSNVRGVGGNEAYAPPEIAEREMVNNRKYDVWSLGCIILEVATFVIKGWAGLLDLDKSRCQDDAEAPTNDDRFFRPVPAPRQNLLSRVIHKSTTYELKPQILQWIRDLPKSVPEGPSRLFIDRVLSVILQMLNVDVSLRLTSGDVCSRLSDIIRDYNDYGSQSRNNANAVSQCSSEGTIVGTELMAEIQTLSYDLEGYSNTAPLHFVQENAFLYAYIFEHRAYVRRQLGLWSQLRLLPQYAMRDLANHSSPELTISFTSANSSTTSERRNGTFSTPNILTLQEILLAQKVHKNLKLNTASAELRRARSLSAFMRRRSSRGRHSDPLHGLEVDANSVQLWTESFRQDMIGPDVAARRQSPRSLRLGPGPVRIVVFYQKSILILRIAKNQRIKKKSDLDPSLASLTIIPTDEATDPSFRVSILRPSLGELLAGFYLSKDAFEAQEMDNSVECDSLKLTFPSQEEADSFHRTYKKLKKQWAEQLKGFKTLQNHIPSEIGYSQTT